jgi:hypothetical protein
MGFNFNKAVQQNEGNTSSGFKSSDFQKMFADDAPTLGYISSKGPCHFILVPPHPTYGASTSLTSGGFRQEKERGVVPTLGQYGIDWVMVYRKIGNDPDPKKRKDILAINMLDGPDGMTVQTEREWGNGYKSPMYKFREYLWKCGGGHKYDKNQRRSVPTINVDSSTARYKRALELVPVDNNDLNAPLGRAVRTMFLQGFVVENAGISYLKDDEGQPCWPRHKILMINQVSAIKSREDARIKEGFYDAWFERTDGLPMDPETIMNTYGDISQSEEAQLAWEAGFKHSDFGVNQKLVTFGSYKAGPAGIATYTCSVGNVADQLGNYALPDEVLQKVRPFSDYILENNEKLQIQWLLELFPGDEWLLAEAKVIGDGSNHVAMGGFSAPAQMAIPSKPAPAAPAAPIPAAMPKAPAIAVPAMPKVAAPAAPVMPKIATPAMSPAATPAPAVKPQTSKSAHLTDLMNKLSNISNKS